MPRFHIGLKKNSPVQAIELGGYSFQKESWIFDEDGNHSVQPGLKFTIDDDAAAKAFEAKWKKDAERFVFRTSITKAGVRAETVDITIPGEFVNKKKDLRVARFCYCERIAEESEEDLPTAKELLEAGDDEGTLAQKTARAIREAKRDTQKTEIGEKE